MDIDIEKALVDSAWPYWECEGEIAKRYFAIANNEDHRFYLKAQLWKELHPVDGFFNGLHKELEELVAQFPEVDKSIDRHDYHFLLTQLTEEFNHYVLLADIFEYVVGRKICADDTIQLPEEIKLGNLRREYVNNGDDLTRAAVGFTEGGGARLFREGAKLSGNRLNEMTAKAMQVIYDDEKDHFVEQAKVCVKLIKSRADLDRMVETIEAISSQRVAMRAEMFPRAMTNSEIKAFISANTKS